MDATLAFALGKFQEEQTETMRTEVAKVQAEREQQVATLTERQRKRAEHHQARASELKKKMVDVESILPHLDGDRDPGRRGGRLRGETHRSLRGSTAGAGGTRRERC